MSFIPLSELQGERISIALPEYVPEEQIGINVDRLDKIAGLGGFVAGVTITSFAGKTTEIQPSIVGSDRQGTAYAGASVTRRADASNEEFASTSKPWADDHNYPPLNIRVNMPEIMQRITNAQGRLRDPGPWARELNNAVTDSLRRASWQHYVQSPKYGELFPLAFGAVCGEMFGPDTDTPTTIASLLIASNVIKVAWGLRQKLHMNEICWSATPVVHPDRALIVSGMSRALKIVKQLPAAA